MGVFISGEARIDNPSEYAERIISEAQTNLISEGWRRDFGFGGIKIESSSVAGPYESAPYRVSRGRWFLQGKASDLFDFLVSPEGYGVLDPLTGSKEHLKKPLQIYDWGEDRRLEAVAADARMPLMGRVEFVVCNAIDPSGLIFVSKSIIHPSRPGGSIFSGEPSLGGPKRAVNTFCVKMEHLSEREFEMRCLNYINLGIGIPGWALNIINSIFLISLHGRCVRIIK